MRRKRRLLPVLVLLLAALCVQAWAAGTDVREPRIPPQNFLPPAFTEVDVELESRLGTLRGILTQPVDAEGELPVAILLHGLATDRRWCDDMAWALAAHGIASVRFDFGGTGLSDGAQEAMTVSTQVSDVTAMLRYVEGLAWADTGNIFLVGKSMGGVDAVLATQGHSDEIKAICLWYPGFGITDQARQGHFLGEFFFPWDPPETLTVSGYSFGREFLKEAQFLDLPAACRKCQAPVLIIHGDRDLIAPVVYTFGLSGEFPDCTVHVMPGGGHGFQGFQELAALEDMVFFLTAQLAK